MRIKEWWAPSNPCRHFKDNEQLYHALQRLQHSAILCVQTRAMPSARKFAKQYHLPQGAADEVLNRSTLIFLRKIEDGTYRFQGNAPSTYLVEIMRRVALMMTRTPEKHHETLDDHHDLHDADVEAARRGQESADLVSQFLGQLGEPCASVIRLYHIDGYSDEEVVRLSLTRYTTTDSLKIKRSDCMKKLIQIAQKWKSTNNT